MDYLSLDILSLHQALIDQKITPLELVKIAIEKAKNDQNNAFEYICEKEAIDFVAHLDPAKKNNLLWGIPYVLKDNFSTKDIPTCASSNVLNGYVPVFSSEVFLRLANQGAVLIGKCTLDELAMGGTGTTGHKGLTYNPWDPTHTHMVGGSSCGSAASVAAGIVPFSIGSDTGDSVRKPASYAGLVGMKPTWGRISRFGLFPFATSLDHVAFFTRNVSDSAIVLEALAGRDEKDSSSSFHPVEKYSQLIRPTVKGKRLAIVKEIYESISNKNIISTFDRSIKALQEEGAIVDFVSMDIKLCKAIYPTYIVIACSEATSNNANLDGIKFGPRFEGKDYEEVMTKARTEGFCEMIKRRFVIGSYSLFRENQNEVFLRAQKCRRLIVEFANKILAKYDAVYLPAAPTTAPLFRGEKNDKLSNEYLISDNHLAIGNFAGLPSIVLPLGFEKGLPFGANLTSKKFSETELFSLAKAVEDVTGLKNLVAKEVK
ncbi:MAG TPA: amidase family protein [Bacilli bacterium]|nr:amidase family protein [Bacilli bacterium]